MVGPGTRRPAVAAASGYGVVTDTHRLTQCKIQKSLVFIQSGNRPRTRGAPHGNSCRSSPTEVRAGAAPPDPPSLLPFLSCSCRSLVGP